MRPQRLRWRRGRGRRRQCRELEFIETTWFHWMTSVKRAFISCYKRRFCRLASLRRQKLHERCIDKLQQCACMLLYIVLVHELANAVVHAKRIGYVHQHHDRQADKYIRRHICTKRIQASTRTWRDGQPRRMKCSDDASHMHCSQYVIQTNDRQINTQYTPPAVNLRKRTDNKIWACQSDKYKRL